jgi:multiple sugar transport system ATP-binding protein
MGSPAMNLCRLPVSDGHVSLGGYSLGVNGHREVVVGLRPEALMLGSRGVAARVDVVEELGADAYAFCTAALPEGETRLIARADARHPPALGESVHLRPLFEEAHLFDAETGERLD